MQKSFSKAQQMLNTVGLLLKALKNIFILLKEVKFRNTRGISLILVQLHLGYHEAVFLHTWLLNFTIKERKKEKKARLVTQ